MKKKNSAYLQYAIWIDQKKAIIVSMDETGKISTETIASSIETYVRFAGEKSNKSRLFGSTLDQQKHMQNQLQQKHKAFLIVVAAHLSKTNSIIILGPAETKYELRTELEKKKSFENAVIELENADKMKINEIKKFLKEYSTV